MHNECPLLKIRFLNPSERLHRKLCFPYFSLAVAAIFLKLPVDLRGRQQQQQQHH